MTHCSEVLGIGAPILDNIVLVSEEFLSSVPGRKGGMELIAYETFKEMVEKIPKGSAPIPAGCTVNIVRGLAHLGHTCTFVGKSGTDEASDFFSKSLKEIGVETSLVPSKTPTAQALCFVTPDGERTIRTYIGAAGKIKGKHLSADLFAQTRHVHIEGYCVYYGDLIDQVMEKARKNNATVSIDLGSFETVERFADHFRAIIAGGIDILFANDKEALALTCQTPKEACSSLYTITNKTVVVTEGARGCWVMGRDLDAPVHCDAYPVEKVVDTTGAGDTFACGFLHGFLSRLPTLECARKGSLAASMVIQIKGTNLSKSDWLKIE